MKLKVNIGGLMFLEAWQLTGRSMERAYKNFGPLLKIWLPTILTVFLISTLVSYLGRGAFMQSMMATYFTGVPTLSGGATFILIAMVLFVLFITAALFVNSCRYYLSPDYKLTWVPFQFEWKRSFVIFGYSLLFFVIFMIASAILMGMTVGLIYSVSPGETDYPYATIDWGLGQALITIAIIALAVATIFLVIVFLRLVQMFVARSIGQKWGFMETLRNTRPQRAMFAWVLVSQSAAYFVMIIFLYFGMLLAFILPLTLLFFLPDNWILAVCGILFVLVFAVIEAYIYFFAITLNVEIFERFYLNAETPKVEEATT